MERAWREIVDGPGGEWDRFAARFRFRAGTNPDRWPAITEPPGAVTLDLGPAFDLGPGAFEAARQAVDQLVLLAWTRLTAPDDSVVALDWQHPSYRFWPHRQALQPQPWPVTPFPDGDYHAFVTDRLDQGTFGHPWERTLCVFGDRLVPVLVPLLATWLPVRRETPQ